VNKVQEVAVPLAAWQHACSRLQKQHMMASIRGNSSSSGVGGKDDTDDGRFCATCKLCQAELRRLQEAQEQQEDAVDGSSSSSGCTVDPVDTADPFMMRRLVWRLLGSIKPSARRLWAADNGMCPHAENPQ
jgi:hypothetical protein